MNTLKKVYMMIFKLMAERLGDTIIIEGTEVTREDFNFDAVVIPNGSIDLTDQNVRITKAANRLQFVMTGTPEIINAEDKYNAAYDWLIADGVQDPERYITKPQAIAQQQQQKMQAEDQVLQQQEQMMDKEIRQKKAAEMMGGQQPQRQMARV
jgi:5-formaminoimidazole-4-carboxamide-1-beta-D-ribofuranosyl 5'-monophosphate synthetase